MTAPDTPDPVIELVLNAIGCGVMLATHSPQKLHDMLRAAERDGGTLADALRDEAEAFVVTRADLIEALP